MHMIQKYVLILLIASFAAISIYFFQNKNYHQDNLSTKVENQEGIPGGHFALTTHNGEIYNSESDKNHPRGLSGFENNFFGANPKPCGGRWRLGGVHTHPSKVP